MAILGDRPEAPRSGNSVRVNWLSIALGLEHIRDQAFSGGTKLFHPSVNLTRRQNVNRFAAAMAPLVLVARATGAGLISSYFHRDSPISASQIYRCS